MNAAEAYINQKLAERKAEGNFRSLKSFDAFIDFTSNDYLGISRNTEFQKAVNEEISSQNFKLIGATGSRLLSGNSAYAEMVENEIAVFHQASSALIFNSGFDANYGLIAALARNGHLIVTDEMVHASIHDGARASKATTKFFRHNDAQHLAEILSEATQQVKYVVIESLYSMDGDVADLESISAICKKYDAALIVDEAHATGVFGNGGEGLVQELGLVQDVFARVVTFGKALGVHGACVLGSKDLYHFLVNHSRSFIFSTALPFHTLAAIRTAYNFLPKLSREREQLWSNIVYYANSLKQTNLNFTVNDSPIQNFNFNGNEAAVQAAAALNKVYIDARPIRFPTVQRGKERIRICLHSYNSNEEIELLIHTLKINS
jgi:8-amino-7-oxononanoate synthase